MRLKSLFAAAFGVIGISLAAAAPASADGEAKAAGYGKTRHITHHVYAPRYVHHYKVDPYSYYYSPRGYYPYYNSGYWGPASYIKWRNREHYNVWNTGSPRFKYYKAWGYPRENWNQRRWHYAHHGFHHRWHW